MLELDDESKIIKKVLVITEMCWWLRPGLDGRKVCSQELNSLITNIFYPRGASDARVLAVIECLSASVCVCLSVCLSHAGIVSKRLNVGSRKQHHVIAQW